MTGTRNTTSIPAILRMHSHVSAHLLQAMAAKCLALGTNSFLESFQMDLRDDSGLRLPVAKRFASVDFTPFYRHVIGTICDKYG